ncbi:MAG: O-antigen ligase family protein [Chitinophagaceae bacterium]|nr:MAG: O-antigen ligase family protein [Chitinophagaceae bacterium]
MNLVTSKPVNFLLGKAQLFLFVFPLTSLVLVMPALAPVEAAVNALSYALILLSIAYLIFSDEIRITLSGAGPLLLFAGFLVLSMSWVPSGMKSISQHFTTRTLLTLLQGFVIVNVLGREGLFRTLKQLAIFIALLNLAFMILFPMQASWYGEDSSRIQGLFSSPNNMGQFLAFAFIVVNFVERDRLPLPVLLALDAIIVYQLFQCDSMTSLSGCILIFICFRLRFLLKPLFFAVIALGLIVPHLNRIFGESTASLGVNNRDMTFTGRTGVWDIMVSDLKAQDRITTGFGSGGYWMPEESFSPYNHIHELEWWPGQGHNGYMDVLVMTGIVGVCLLVFFLVSTIVSLFRRVPYEEPVCYFLLLIVLINNITEASFFREKHLYFVLLSLVFWCLFLRREEAPAAIEEETGDLQLQPA